MKVGTDGTLLGAWANAPVSYGKILDIGTGTGLVALMMAQRFPEAQVVGIDIDEDAAIQAKENVDASPFSDRITIIHGDATKMDDNAMEYNPIQWSGLYSSGSFWPRAHTCVSCTAGGLFTTERREAPVHTHHPTN